MFTLSKAFSSFSTDDLEKSKAFYEKILGVEIKQGKMGFLELHLGGNNPVMIYPKGKGHVPASFTVLNFIVKEIETTVDQLMLKSIVFEQYDSPIKSNEKGICYNEEGPAIAWFKDPAGNILSVLQE